MKKFLFILITMLLATLATQAATPLNVAGKDISCDKDVTLTASDVTDIKSGTVTYTKSTNTLTLTNVTIYRTGSSAYCIHNRSNKSLIVKFVGTCNLTSTNARVIRFQCGGASSGYQSKLIAASGATVNMSSTNDGAIYVRDNTSLLIEGPGTYNIIGQKDGAIAGHGSWNATITDGATKDYISFSNVTATVTGAQGSLLGLESVNFYSGSKVTLKATNSSSYPVIRQVKAINCYGNTAIISPADAYYSSSSESVVLNGSNVYNQDIYISDNYALLLDVTNFPDANFRSAMLSLYPKGYLTQSELNNLTSLNVANMGISDMWGIEKLTNLKELRCYGNSFTSLNLSDNTKLTYLDCAPNPQLTMLIISECTNLETLICYQTGIYELDLSNLSKLKTVSCYNCPNMEALLLEYMGSLSSINCSNCTAMKFLIVDYCDALTTLNVTGNTALDYLYCCNNSNLAFITGLADCKAITELYCSDCKITDLSAVNSMTNIEILEADYNRLTSLNVSNKTALKTLYCCNNQLTSINVQGCSALTELDACSNKLNSLNLQGCTALNELYCAWNQIKAAGMTTLINSLPTRPSSSKGYLYALYNTGEGNVFNASHLSAAQAKNWNAYRYTGSGWELIKSTGLRGDVNGDGEVSVADINALVDIILGGSADSETRKRADVNEDGEVGIADVNVLVGLILEQ